jgi:CheY-like chemotaxis protein/GAF domain-containing protein
MRIWALFLPFSNLAVQPQVLEKTGKMLNYSGGFAEKACMTIALPNSKDVVLLVGPRGQDYFPPELIMKLERRFIRVVHVTSTTEGLRRWESERCNVILVAESDERIDAFVFKEELGKRPGGRKVRVVFVSRKAKHNTLQRAIGANFADFIVLPMPAGRIVEKIRQNIKRAQSGVLPQRKPLMVKGNIHKGDENITFVRGTNKRPQAVITSKEDAPDNQKKNQPVPQTNKTPSVVDPHYDDEIIPLDEPTKSSPDVLKDVDRTPEEIRYQGLDFVRRLFQQISGSMSPHKQLDGALNELKSIGGNVGMSLLVLLSENKKGAVIASAASDEMKFSMPENLYRKNEVIDITSHPEIAMAVDSASEIVLRNFRKDLSSLKRIEASDGSIKFASVSPVLYRGTLIGVLVSYIGDNNNLSDDEISAFPLVASMVGKTVYRMGRLFPEFDKEKVRKAEAEQTPLPDVIATQGALKPGNPGLDLVMRLTRIVELESSPMRIINQAMLLMRGVCSGSLCSVGILNESNEQIRILSTSRGPVNRESNVTLLESEDKHDLPLGENQFLELAVTEQVPVVVAEAKEELPPLENARLFVDVHSPSTAFFPIINRDKTVGMLTIKGGKPFSEYSDEMFLAFQSVAAALGSAVASKYFLLNILNQYEKKDEKKSA